eukprot:3380146-Pyramimonas_sp.AAC.1
MCRGMCHGMCCGTCGIWIDRIDGDAPVVMESRKWRVLSGRNAAQEVKRNNSRRETVPLRIRCRNRP